MKNKIKIVLIFIAVSCLATNKQVTHPSLLQQSNTSSLTLEVWATTSGQGKLLTKKQPT
jgi:hypothetical protein